MTLVVGIDKRSSVDTRSIGEHVIKPPYAHSPNTTEYTICRAQIDPIDQRPAVHRRAMRARAGAVPVYIADNNAIAN